MPAPRRIPNSVYIMVPTIDTPMDLVVHTSRVVGRIVRRKGYLPLSPLLFYLPYMSEAELDKELPDESVKMHRRASCIWLCDMRAERDTLIPLDWVAHSILMNNEGMLYPRRRHYSSSARVPVWSFTQEIDNSHHLEVLSRSEIAAIIRGNVYNGLLRGAA